MAEDDKKTIIRDALHKLVGRHGCGNALTSYRIILT